MKKTETEIILSHPKIDKSYYCWGDETIVLSTLSFEDAEDLQTLKDRQNEGKSLSAEDVQNLNALQKNAEKEKLNNLKHELKDLKEKKDQANHTSEDLKRLSQLNKQIEDQELQNMKTQIADLQKKPDTEGAFTPDEEQTLKELQDKLRVTTFYDKFFHDHINFV